MLNLFVPEPVAPPPPVPAVNVPVAKNEAVSSVTYQVMVTLAGQGESGVQVRTVLAAFQLSVTVYAPKGLREIKLLVTDAGSTAVEKVNTTGEFTDTPVAPLAGLLVTVCADRFCWAPNSNPAIETT